MSKKYKSLMEFAIFGKSNEKIMLPSMMAIKKKNKKGENGEKKIQITKK